jgi:hypothetical protein
VTRAALCLKKSSVRVLGYCHAPVARIAALIESGNARGIVHLGGNFVVVATRGTEVWIVTAPYGVVAYFFSSGRGGFSHGQTVAEILSHSTLDWCWNYRALADLFALEHLTGSDTLHAGIQRTPAASVLHWDGSALNQWSATWSEIHQPLEAQGSASRMVDILREEVGRCAGSSPVVSASGGFDSRVLLAALLAEGARPELIVQGYPTSTDRVVVEAIGRRFGLKVRAVAPTAEDYLSCAERICRATNGTKPAEHWHTYIYPAKAGLDSNDRLFVGANGEFVRTYYLDKGVVARAADLLPPRFGLAEFWKRKIKPEFKGQDLSGLCPQLADYLRHGSDLQVSRLAKARPNGSLLRQLDHFYLEERVRHFIANGLALYGLSARWVAPFLAPAWVAEADRLPRRWKLGSNWHRYAIARLCPDLLDFPEEKVAATMARQHSPLYWLPSRRRQEVVPYVDYKAVFADERVLSVMLDHAADIGDLIDERFVRDLVLEHRARGGTRQRTISILLGLSLWRRVSSEGIRGALGRATC